MCEYSLPGRDPYSAQPWSSWQTAAVTPGRITSDPTDGRNRSKRPLRIAIVDVAVGGTGETGKPITKASDSPVHRQPPYISRPPPTATIWPLM
jgi:hypothetical protein